jgi:hypothetical protein
VVCCRLCNVVVKLSVGQHAMACCHSGHLHQPKQCSWHRLEQAVPGALLGAVLRGRLGAVCQPGLGTCTVQLLNRAAGCGDGFPAVCTCARQCSKPVLCTPLLVSLLAHCLTAAMHFAAKCSVTKKLQCRVGKNNILQGWQQWASQKGQVQGNMRWPWWMLRLQLSVDVSTVCSKFSGTCDVHRATIETMM